MAYVDHEKLMVWAMAVAAILQRGHNAKTAAKDADLVAAEYEQRRNDGFFCQKDRV